MTAKQKTKSRALIAIIISCICFFTGLTRAELIAYDSFDYALGTTLADGEMLGDAENGFVNAWILSGMTGEIVSNLSYSRVESSGNALSITGGGGYLFRGMASGLSTGTYYVSYLFFREETEGWNLQLKTSTSYAYGPTSGTKLLATCDASPVGRSRLKVGDGTISTADAPYFTFGTTNLVLIKLEITDTDTTAFMNIYSDGAAIDTTSWAMTSSYSTTGGGGWRLSVSGTSALLIDEFKIGTELNDVLPPFRRLGLFLVY